MKESKSRAEIFNHGPGRKKLGVGDFTGHWGPGERSK